MNPIKEIILGLEIFLEYDPPGHFNAANGYITAGFRGPKYEEMKSFHITELEDFGWKYDKQLSCWKKMV